MNRPSPFRLALYASVMVLLGLVGNIATGLIDVPDAKKPWVLALAAVLAVAAIVVDVQRSRNAGPQEGVTGAGDVGTALEAFAQTVAGQWRREEQFRRLHDPFPIPLRWQPGPATLTDHWSNIRRTRPGANARALDLRGSLAQVVDVYQRVPAGRLVVLGRAGAGKTILAIRFVLDSIHRRRPGDPVPVIFRLNSWDPTTQSLHDWMVKQLLDDYPTMGAFDLARNNSFAATLVDDGHILPIFDGLDEIAEGLLPDAIRALNATSNPFILTSRGDEYAEAVAASDVVTAAAVVCLTDVTITDLRSYLPRTARVVVTIGRPLATKWSRLLDELPTVEGLRTALSTPLMVSLARTVYSDNPTADPIELLDPERFGSRQSIEDHLLDSYIREVYQSAERTRLGATNAEQWLAYLARHLQSLGTRDFAWWDLRSAIGRPTRLMLFVLLGATGAALALLPVWQVGAGLGLGFAAVPALWRHGRQPIRSPLKLRGRGARTLLLLLLSALGGVLGGLLGGRISDHTGALVLDPFMGVTNAVDLRSPLGFVIGAGAGLSLAAASSFDLAGTSRTPRPRTAVKTVTRGAILAFVGALVGSVALGPVGGLAIGVTAGPMAALIADFETVLDAKFTSSPLQSLWTDRRNANIQRLLLGTTFGFSVFLAAAERTAVVTSIFLGLGSALVIALGNGLVGTASGQWLIVRTYLALSGRLPFTMTRFLEDAHERGVLRQAGSVFQFRHIRLQERLASPDAPVMTRATTPAPVEG